MSYGLIYTLPFNGIDGKDYTIKIEKEGYQGTSAELTGQPSPFTVTLSDEEFVYTPTRFSTATLHIFGGDYLQDLFSTDYRMCRVTLYEGDRMIWRGFIKPEIYTQDYRNVKFNLDLECYSAMSVLEYVDYKQKGESRGFVTLWDLLKQCIEESRGEYGFVYLPHVYGTDQSAFNAWNNPLSEMSVSEQNFFDEDDNPMTYKNVLEEIMKLMNWTCVDYMGDLYFIDINNQDGEYYQYGPSTFSKVQAGSMSVQDIGFSGDGHTLDIAPGYNKVTIRCSNYPVGDALPDTSFDTLKYLTSKDTKIYQSNTQGYKVTHYEFMNSENERYKLWAYKYGSEEDDMTDLSSEELKEEIDKATTWELASITGAIPVRYDEYNEDKNGNADITDYEFTEQYYIKTGRRTADRTPIFSRNNRIPIMTIKGVPAAYSNGAFAIYFSLEMLATMTGGLATYDFHFRLRIGSKYYHGGDNGYYWDTNPEPVVGEYTNNLWVDFDDTNANDFKGPYEIQTKGRKLNDGLDGVKGYVCHLPEDEILYGDMEFTLFGPHASFVIGSTPANYFAIQNFEFSYAKYSTNDDSEDSDRTYENVVNENYINELDEIELKISSYNNDGACYSKVLFGDKYLESNLYCGITGNTIRPEELLIRRIVDYYSATKLRLTEVLKRADITPITKLTDRTQPGKYFLTMGGEIDYKMNSFKVIMVEVV
ncbi:hypothetical protein [Phocaeicola plebeius]|mgnify:FL=1|uniref:hypothetical protein n=1 Tax=Phocaeicola plebeius TaxID=310297 RepID=UPI0029437EAE|nr:hypothetical protein [Phocaeicola plebeius]